MSASEPWFPCDVKKQIGAESQVGSMFSTPIYQSTPMPGCSKLLMCMLHAPVSEIQALVDAAIAECGESLTDENRAVTYIQIRRAWAEALIKESERG